MKQVNIITVILFAFLFISCQNKKLSKIESRTRFLIQKSTEKENCSISYDSCVFQNDSICIVDYILGSMESLRNFVPFTDDDCIRYVKQAVKLLISYMVFFMPLLDIGGCLYVRL